MILDRPTITPEALEKHSGWVVAPEGACRGESCVLLRQAGPELELRIGAENYYPPLFRADCNGELPLACGPGESATPGSRHDGGGSGGA